MFSSNFSRWVGEVTGHSDLQLGLIKAHRHSSFAIPNIWQTSMMNEEFWEVQVAKFGIRALQVPKVIVTENLFHPSRSMKSALPVSTRRLEKREPLEIQLRDQSLESVTLQSAAQPLTAHTDPERTAPTLWDQI